MMNKYSGFTLLFYFLLKSSGCTTSDINSEQYFQDRSECVITTKSKPVLLPGNVHEVYNHNANTLSLNVIVKETQDDSLNEEESFLFDQCMIKKGH